MSGSLGNPVRAVFRWLRVVRTPVPLLVIAVVGSACWELLYWITLRFGQRLNPADYFQPRDMMFVCCAGLYGVFRVRAYHPVLDSEYYLWLVRTPWVRGKPLPRGPVHLMPQDLLFLGILLLLRAWHPALPWPVFPLAFLLGYLVALAWSLWLTGQPAAAYGGLFLIGLAIHALPWSPLAALGVAVAAYGLAISAYWRSLLDFPWYDTITTAMQTISRQTTAFKMPAAATVEPGAIAAFGELPIVWAYGAVHHRHDRHSLRVFDSWSLGLLLGWFVSALLSAAPNAPPEFCYLFIVITSMACILMRLYRYRVGHASPISFLGRLFTGRWIIPGYDRVFLAPLAALFTVAGLPPLLWSLRLPNPSIAGITAGLVVLITLLAPPPLRQWQLTAPARLRPATQKSAKSPVAEV